MESTRTIIENFLIHCKNQKRLDSKTLKAYQIDLKQFASVMPDTVSDITPSLLEQHIAMLHHAYMPRTVKRKIATAKALFHYMEFKDYITINPFNKLQIRFREPFILPKTIPLPIVEKFLATIYKQRSYAKTRFQQRNALRDIAVIEFLFATGVRISELCSLKPENINLDDYSFLIYGKGSKERQLQIGNTEVCNILKKYCNEFQTEIHMCNHFFVNQSGTPLSDQSVRRMIRKYTELAAIDLHITPHMFRHTFATSLLEADVDIRYIQEMLGHSSIHITEIYTHVSMHKQRDILTTKHPRKDFRVEGI